MRNFSIGYDERTSLVMEKEKIMNKVYGIIGIVIGAVVACLGYLAVINGGAIIDAMSSTNAVTMIAVRTYMTTDSENYVDIGVMFKTLMTVLFKM